VCCEPLFVLLSFSHCIVVFIRVTDSDYHFGMKLLLHLCIGGRRMVVGFTTTAIKAKVLSMNAARDEVYSIQHYVIKFVTDLRQVGGFSPSTHQ
jgi:hypothetical protein